MRLSLNSLQLYWIIDAASRSAGTQHAPRVPSASAAEPSCPDALSTHPVPPSEMRLARPIRLRIARQGNSPSDCTYATSDQNGWQGSVAPLHPPQSPHDRMTSRSDSYLKVHVLERWSIHAFQWSIPPNHREDTANERRLGRSLSHLDGSGFCESSRHFSHCRSTKSSFVPWFFVPKSSSQQLPGEFCWHDHWGSWRGSHQQRAWWYGPEVLLQSSGRGKGGNYPPPNVWNAPVTLVEAARTVHHDPNGTSNLQTPQTRLGPLAPVAMHGQCWAAAGTCGRP